MIDIDIKLKPCPFCGGKAKLKKGFPYQQNNRTKYAFVQCTKCRAKSGTNQQYPFESYGDMIKFTVRDWNERVKPVADVRPERHGEWLYCEDGIYECSECGAVECSKTPYCWRCGAKMDGKDGDSK